MDILKTRVLFLVVTFLMAFLPFYIWAEVDQPFIKTKLKERLVDQMGKLSVNFGVPLPELELVEGVSISTKYNYELYPSLNDSLYTRVDGWELNFDINAGDILGQSSDMFTFGMNRGSKVFFVRHFETQKKAAMAKPYGLNRIPLTAKSALSKLNPGDLVSMPAELSFSLGASSSSIRGLGFLSNAQTMNFRIFLSGKFIIQVLRMEDNKVRLRLITEAARGSEFELESRIGANLFGVSFIDEKLRSIHPLTLAEIDLGSKRGKQFIMDYVFDLSDKDAQKAYDNILNSRLKLKDFTAAKSMLEQGAIKGERIASFEKADEVYEQDLLKARRSGEANFRVQRLFKGTNNFKTNSMRLKLNLILVEMKGNSIFTKNVISKDEGEGRLEKYDFQVYEQERETKGGFGYNGFKEKNVDSFFSILDMEARDELSIFPDIGVTLQLRDEVFNRTNQGAIHSKLAKVLPRSIFAELDLKKPEEKLKDVTLGMKLHISGNLFNQIPRLRENELDNRAAFKNNFVDYIQDLQLRGIMYSDSSKMTAPGNYPAFLNILYNFIYKNDWSAGKKQKKLMSLRGNDEFKEFGIGFLLSLVSYTDMIENISFEYSISGENLEPKVLEKGDSSIGLLFKEVSDIKAALDYRSYDLQVK